MIYAIDFDGVIAECNTCLKPLESNIAYVKKLKKQGNTLILWTCREGEDMEEALAFCKEHGIEFDYVNENAKEILDTFDEDDIVPRKIYANYYLDDSSFNTKEIPLRMSDLEKSYFLRGHVKNGKKDPFYRIVLEICKEANDFSSEFIQNKFRIGGMWAKEIRNIFIEEKIIEKEQFIGDAYENGKEDPAYSQAVGFLDEILYNVFAGLCKVQRELDISWDRAISIVRTHLKGWI